MYISEKKNLPKSVEVFIKYYCALHLTCVRCQAAFSGSLHGDPQ